MQTRQEKRSVNRFLKANGLPSLDAASGLMEALGPRIMDHKHFQSLLTRCEPAERQHMYDALKPHLRFTPYPLDVYIAQAGQEAEAKQLPTWDGNTFHEYNPFAIKTLWRIDVSLDSLTADRLMQAMRYLQRDIADEVRQEVVYKVHLREINGSQRFEITAGVFVNGKAQRIQ
jgi:hypothetical protein